MMDFPLVQPTPSRPYVAPTALPHPLDAATPARTAGSQADAAPAANRLSASTVSVVDKFQRAVGQQSGFIERYRDNFPAKPKLMTVAKRIPGGKSKEIRHAMTQLDSLIDAQQAPILIVDSGNVPLYVFERREDGSWVGYRQIDNEQLTQTPQQLLASMRGPTSHFVCVSLLGLGPVGNRDPARTSQDGGLGQEGTLQDRARRRGAVESAERADPSQRLRRTPSSSSASQHAPLALQDPRGNASVIDKADLDTRVPLLVRGQRSEGASRDAS